ncbi:uncharacterized protein LY89DRAFT_582181 [Mollisia scopiformis]|uniref:Peptide N-acetyl-beta-D-glucosaminyl asparaginase amidase A N-terminal domain-containing protein n=1 Tax=Mollisia scopiformis TaxID=149040 RepID=A0A194XF06_MOLSC|nr:uncharacterized protein LY89DRAFT_582181 [Mollisia scopiformis]KUJ18719.1 hypothetical protein LY89DRAFT_582181 [Mollisia scopiformis]
MGIVQVVLLVIVVGSIALAVLESFSKDGYWKDCEVGEEKYFRTNPIAKGEAVHVHVVRDLEIRQESNSAASFISITTDSSTISATAAAATPQRVFQVDAPVLGAGGFVFDGDNVTTSTVGASADGTTGQACSVTLMEFSFAESFGKPFVGNYTPPACMGNSNTVMMNFSVTSKGTQFDRLAIMYFGDTEAFRTSTAEPKRNGITWEYVKDMSHMMYFWKTPQKVIFDLPNQTTANLTGAYNTTLTATFFTAKQAVSPATMILPISARLGINASQPSDFSLPASNATNTISDFPRNANRAIVTLSTTGQGNEEFWWSNALQSDVLTYNASGGTLFGFSPFREVQLHIDGQMAGVQWPFPIIFTGGVVPAFWSPMVGIDAFDLKEAEVEISPWLPMLCDGNPHTFSINVVGLDDNGSTSATMSKSVGSSWLVTGKIFIWQDDANSITTGSMPTVSASDPTVAVSQSLAKNSTGANDTLQYTVSVSRKFSVSSTLTTQNSSVTSSWSQTLSHTDNGTFLAGGNIQTNFITTTGRDVATLGAATPYTCEYSFPMFANSTAVQLPNGTTTFNATIQRTKIMDTNGRGVAPSGLQPFAVIPQSADLVLTLAGTTRVDSQNGTAFLFLDNNNGNNSFSFGNTVQSLRFGGKSAAGALGMEPDVELYFRSVEVSNGSTVSDTERLVGKSTVGNKVVSNGVVRRVDAGVGRNAQGVLMPGFGGDDG